ncbi:MAG: hypothetical protein WCL50_09955 [Spirochaetota bacterium]
MTEASARALVGLRDFSTLQWYVIPILAIVFYIYTGEIKKARAGGDWKALIAGAAVFGADLFNESWNGWILVLTGRSALWTAPGPSALRTMVGLNIEIMFMFSLLGIVWYNSLSGKAGTRILGLSEGWFFGIAYSLVSVVVEVALNAGGLLVWEYPFWNRSPLALVPIFFVGYLWFFAWAILATSRKSTRSAWLVVALPYGLAALLALLALSFGLRY